MGFPEFEDIDLLENTGGMINYWSQIVDIFATFVFEGNSNIGI